MNRLNKPNQRDSFDGIDPIEFARAKLAQGLRNLVKKVFKSNDCGAVITPGELVQVDKPTAIEVPEGHTIYAFKLRRDMEEKVFLIMFKNKPDGCLDVMERALIWQDNKPLLTKNITS